MNANNPLEKLIVRTGVVRGPRLGYILAADPRRQEDDEPHTEFFKWADGKWVTGSLNFDAHTCCLAAEPETTLVMAAGNGDYGLTTGSARLADNIFRNSLPAPVSPRYGDIRWTATVGGRAHAAGHNGSLYRLDSLQRWTRIDDGLPAEFNAEAVDGNSPSDLFAVGNRGAIWHFDGVSWQSVDSGTNVNLTRVTCTSDGNVVVAGHRGVLLIGKPGSLAAVAHQATEDDIWSVREFKGQIFVATASALFTLTGSSLVNVNFGSDPPGSFYHLSATADVMWSIGERDVMSFDGQKWGRIA